MQLSRLRGGPSIFGWGLVRFYLKIKASGSRSILGRFEESGLGRVGRGKCCSLEDQRDEVFYIGDILINK